MRKSTPFWFLCALQLQAQGIIVTVAGTDFVFPRTPVLATAAPAGVVVGVAVAAGNLYVSDISNSLVFKVDSQGILTVVAGNGTAGFSGDGGSATGASLNSPEGLAVDGAGNLFVADTNNSRIRKVSPDGTITTVAGDGFAAYGGDGLSATHASLGKPNDVAVDAAGNLYIADTGNHRIRKVNSLGIITTFAGNGLAQPASSASDGSLANQVPVFNPTGVAVDINGNVFVAGDGPVRKITPDGFISSIFLKLALGCSAITARVGVDAIGNVFVSGYCNMVFELFVSGNQSRIAGGGAFTFSGDGGSAVGASLATPLGVAVDTSGNVFVADATHHRVRRVETAGIIRTVVGNNTYQFGGDGGNALSAFLSSPRGLATDAAGDVYIADTQNNRIRRVTPNGRIATIAGNGEMGFSGDLRPGLLQVPQRVHPTVRYPAAIPLTRQQDFSLTPRGIFKSRTSSPYRSREATGRVIPSPTRLGSG